MVTTNLKKNVEFAVVLCNARTLTFGPRTHTQGKKRKIIANDKENTSPDEKNTYLLFYSIKKNVLEENTFCSLDYLLVHTPLAQIMKGKKGVGICPFFAIMEILLLKKEPVS